VVNHVMAASGSAVRYDPRSYKDMGLEVAPMKNVTRILADKLDKRSFVVMDAEWTRRMVDAEMTAAAARRSEAFVKLQESELALVKMAQDAERSKAANLKLPKEKRLSPLRQMSRAASQASLQSIARMRRNRLATAFLDESLETALTHVAAATSPEAVQKRIHKGSSAPDPGDLAVLHTAAIEELARHRGEANIRAKTMRNSERRAEEEWRRGPGTPACKYEDGPSRPGLLVGPADAAAQAETASETQPARQAHQSRARVPLAERRPIPGMPYIPGMPGYRGLITPGVGATTNRSGPFAQISKSMDAFIQPFRDMGVTGQEFAEAMKAMMSELTDGRHQAHQDAADATERASASQQAASTPLPAARASVNCTSSHANASVSCNDVQDHSSANEGAGQPAPFQVGAVTRSNSTIPGQAGQTSAFPTQTFPPPPPSVQDTVVGRLPRPAAVRREHEPASASSSKQPVPLSTQPEIVAAAVPATLALSAPVAGDAASEAEIAAELSAAEKKAEAARRRRQALLARSRQSGPER